jgi:hypothetical protein
VIETSYAWFCNIPYKHILRASFVFDYFAASRPNGVKQMGDQGRINLTGGHVPKRFRVAPTIFPTLPISNFHNGRLQEFVWGGRRGGEVIPSPERGSRGFYSHNFNFSFFSLQQVSFNVFE